MMIRHGFVYYVLPFWVLQALFLHRVGGGGGGGGLVRFVLLPICDLRYICM
jgi:hypothetical protein